MQTDPIHPAGMLPPDDEDWRRGVEETDGLDAAEVRDYQRSETYSPPRDRPLSESRPGCRRNGRAGCRGALEGRRGTS